MNLTTDTCAQAADAAALTDAFDGVCRVGVFYPPGHALCDRAAEAFLRTMIRLVGSAGSLVVEVTESGLAVQGTPLEATVPSAGRLRELLDAMGVIRVECHRDLTAADLYAFVRTLFTHRAQARGATSFRPLAVGDLPPRVRLKLREFQSTADTAEERVAALLEALARRGVAPAQLAACRRLLLAVPGRLAERQELEGVRLRVSWREIEETLAQAAAGQGGPSAGALSSVLRTLAERPDEDVDIAAAVDLLVEAAVPEVALPAADAGSVLDALRGDGRDADLANEDRREHLGILLLLQRRDLAAAARTRLERTLRDLVAGGLSDRERAILGDGLMELAGCERFAAAAALVCGSLRRHSPAAALAFLADLSARLPAERQAALWPFLVNELVVNGRGDDAALFDRACALAAALPDDAALAAQAQLEQLECLHGQNVASDVLHAPSPDLRRVLSWLLESSHAASLARLLAAALRAAPAGWLADATLPLIEHGSADDRRFLAAWLRLRDPARPPSEVTQLAARVIVPGLAGLPPRRRREAWVAPAVAVLGRAWHPLSADLLRRIRGERRLVVLRAWPPACRRVAAGVLKHLAGADEGDA